MDKQKTDRKRGNNTMKSGFFILDNDIFNLKLDAYELQIYAYLVCCAGKKGECWPSINTMARVLGISANTVIRKLNLLIQKRLIDKQETRSVNRNGRVRISNNHYFILPFEKAWATCFHFRTG